MSNWRFSAAIYTVSDGNQPSQGRPQRRRTTPHQLLLTYQAAAKSIPPWPTSPAAIPLHWRHRLLTLQTTNHRYGTPTDHDAYIHAAIYPDAITLAAAELNPCVLFT